MRGAGGCSEKAVSRLEDPSLIVGFMAWRYLLTIRVACPSSCTSTPGR